MAGLVPAIHANGHGLPWDVTSSEPKTNPGDFAGVARWRAPAPPEPPLRGVDGRDKPGHDARAN